MLGRIAIYFLLLFSPLLFSLVHSTSAQFRGFADGIIQLVNSSNGSYNSRQAAFGPRIPEGGIIGRLIAIESIDMGNKKGCRAIPPDKIPSGSRNMGQLNGSINSDTKMTSRYLKPAAADDALPAPTLPPLPNPLPWIALVERGDCSFVEKVRAMMISGAVLVVVGDNERQGLITMYASGDTSDVVVPSVFVGMFEYRELRYEANQRFLSNLIVWIIGNDTSDWPVVDILLITIIAPILLILLTYTLYRVFTRLRPPKPSIPPRLVLSLPTKTFFKEKVKENEPTSCVICLDDFEDEEELRVLPCDHMFHVQCVDSWLLERRNVCPICRATIGVENDSERNVESAAGIGNHTESLDEGNDAGVVVSLNPVVTLAPNEEDDDERGNSDTTPLLLISVAPNRSLHQSNSENNEPRNIGESSPEALTPSRHQEIYMESKTPSSPNCNS